MNRTTILTGSALVAVAALGAVAIVALWDGGGSGEPEPTVTNEAGIEAYADLAPYEVQFGDTVTARVEVTLDRSRVDPDSVRVRADFTPWEPVGAPEVLRRDGESTTYLETRYVLRCLESFCTTPEVTSLQDFQAARVSYTPAGDGEEDGTRTLEAAWPDLLVTARYAPPSASRTSQPPADWEADLVGLPAATYRIGPWPLAGLLLGGAALLAAAGGALFYFTRPRDAEAPATEPAPRGPVWSPLEYALALLEDPGRVNGSGDQRRALQLVADGLVHRGDRPLASTARALAWSRPVPKIEETRGLATRARKSLGEEHDADPA